jgi:uncharacterized membrane protein
VTDASTSARRPRLSLAAGVLVGLGTAAFVDEVVFHQLLHWHHLYDRGTTALALASDGLLHAFDFAALVAGLFLLADLQRRRSAVAPRFWAGVLLGAGAFQVYDGLVQHKLLGLHQVRYGVELLPYDLAWTGAGVVVVLVGAVTLMLTRRTRG